MTDAPHTAETERVGVESSPRCSHLSVRLWTLAKLVDKAMASSPLNPTNASYPSIPKTATTKPQPAALHVIIDANHQTTFFPTRSSDLETESTSICRLTCIHYSCVVLGPPVACWLAAASTSFSFRAPIHASGTSRPSSTAMPNSRRYSF